ncbi:MAG: histidine phosphatase family protein, partial [Thermoanaerobaculia bacterium]
TAIYTTPYARTRDTAAPIASALRLTSIEVKPGPSYAADLAAKIRAEHAGKTVLVVGHSNTTQNVMKALGIENAPKIEETEYDNLFIVTLTSSGAKMLVLKY